MHSVTRKDNMIWVGLPAYNEAGGIKDLLTNLKKTLERRGLRYKIVVYDDGSSDSTVSEVLLMRNEGVDVRLIEGKNNKGLGHALYNLIEYCTDASDPQDTVIIMDADNTHNPEHIYQMFNHLQYGFDVVIASRYTPYSRIVGVNPYRQFLSKTASIVFKIMFPIRGVLDYSCSYRAYAAKTLKMAKELYGNALIEERSFACMAEFLIKLRRLRILACEVPLILRYDRKLGSSKMEIAFTIIRTFRVISKLLFLPRIPWKKLEALREKYKI